jgi:hypothetical protein
MSHLENVIHLIKKAELRKKIEAQLRHPLPLMGESFAVCWDIDKDNRDLMGAV